MKNNTTKRRSFIKKLTGGMLAAGSIPAILAKANDNPHILQAPSYRQKYAANDNIRFAIIGMGIMGFNNCRTATQVPGTELAAVCDLYDGRLEHAKEVYGKDIMTTKNYQEILDRDDIDAVFIATTDHWHDHMTKAALKAGKHVYCEKPMVHHIDEGLSVIEAEKASDKVLQVGSQRVSSIMYAKAKELFEQQIIGKLVMVETYMDRQSAIGAWQYSIPTDASPKTVDWDAYLGDAPKVPYDDNRFFRWRNYQDYGTGIAGDLFVHLFSGLHTVTSALGPERIFATGGLRYWKDGRDVPDLMLGLYDYPETENHPAFNLQMRVNFIDGNGGGSLLKLVGTEGVLEIKNNAIITVTRNPMPENPGYGGWDSYSTFTKAQQEAYKKWYEENYPPKPKMKEPETLTYQTPEGYSDHFAHVSNFFEAVRHDKKVVEDGSFGLRAAAPALATNMSYFESKPVFWDPKSMKVKKV